MLVKCVNDQTSKKGIMVLIVSSLSICHFMYQNELLKNLIIPVDVISIGLLWILCVGVWECK